MSQSINLSIDQSLKPWYAIATPHEDIRGGRLAEAVFAANLWAVVQETAPEVYLDPEEFFSKTHLTPGLSTVLVGSRRIGRADHQPADRAQAHGLHGRAEATVRKRSLEAR